MAEFLFASCSSFPPNLFACSWLLLASQLLGLPLYFFTGQYKALTRYVGSVLLYQLAARNILLVLVLASLGYLLRLPMPPRSSWILLWIVLTALMAVVRLCFRDVLINLRSVQRSNQVRVAIYGAGQAGVQLAASLRLAGSHKIVTFLDDNPEYWNRSINGVPIQPPQVLSKLEEPVSRVCGNPSLSPSSRLRIFNDLQHSGFSVLQVPSVEDLTSGRARIDSLRPVAIEDLLGRDPVVSSSALLDVSLTSCSVCVTGAGGSIGSELCRQILRLSPSHLILLERSEPALYTIEQYLRPLLPDGVTLTPVLGSATELPLMERIFTDHSVDLVFHAAAYKHVPLVESNCLAGIANNVGSTCCLSCCLACRSKKSHSHIY